MEKRIRVVWILSLLSILLLILVQGYWLFNQYTYAVNTYADELARQVLQIANTEYDIRKDSLKGTYSIVVNTNSEYSKNDSGRIHNRNRLIFSMKAGEKPDSTQLEQLTVDSIRRLGKKMAYLPDDSLRKTTINALPVEKMLELSIDTQLSQEEILNNISKAVTNYQNPFSKERLDSILIAGLPDLRFTTTDWDAGDTIYRSRWENVPGFFSPAIRVSYAYSPFQKEGISIYAELPAQPLLEKMAVQLLLALGILLLLTGCLVFQIKTIMKQKKIGELRQNFVNTMIHELKRPVQTLKTFVAFLGDREMCEDHQATDEVVQDSMFELDNLTAYLNKLKDMVRADNEDTPLNSAPFDLRELTDKVIRLTHIPPGKKVKFTTNLNMESGRIEADPIHLANVLSNLIENAIKYSDADVEIGIEASRRGRELWLTVSDNGIGIPLVEQDKVFAKFYRGSNLPDKNIPGLGLGLSYVKLISEAHHGSVSLKSVTGQGTSVTLCIPQ